MNGTFIVVPPAVTTKALSAKVDARTATMSVKRTAAGRYRITVRDTLEDAQLPPRRPGREPAHDEDVHGHRRPGRSTSGSGTYRFGSDPKLTGRLTVS